MNQEDSEVDVKAEILDYMERLRPESLNEIIEWVRKNSDFGLPVARLRQKKLSSLAIVDEEILVDAVFNAHGLDFYQMCGEDDSEE